MLTAETQRTLRDKIFFIAIERMAMKKLRLILRQ
jgi:hypothetical protein